MDSMDLRMLTDLGERLLKDHQGSLRKELLERFAEIVRKVESVEDLTPEQRSVVETFRYTGTTILSKAAIPYP